MWAARTLLNGSAMDNAINPSAPRIPIMTFTAFQKTDHQGLIATALVFATYVSAALLLVQGRF